MKLYTFNQLMQPIFAQDTRSIIKKYDGDKWSKTLSCLTFIKTMLFFQFGGFKSMRGLIAGLKSTGDKHHHSGLKPISLNNLSHALSKKNELIFEEIFCKFRDFVHMSIKAKSLGGKKLRREISAIDSTTISLCKELYGWASFRKKKSGIKIHTEFSVSNGIPGEIIVTVARKHDSTQVKNMNYKPGVIYVLDRAYSCPKTLNSLAESGALFVTRLKDNILFKIISEKQLSVQAISQGVVSDQKIQFTGATNYIGNKDHCVRLVKYCDKETGKEFLFITNVEDLAPQTIAGIYKKRWGVELFFKAIKQNLKVKRFIGCSRNAVMIQIWCALLAYLSFAWQISQTQIVVSFANFMDIVRTNLFEFRLLLVDLLKRANQPIKKRKKLIVFCQQMILNL